MIEPKTNASKPMDYYIIKTNRGSECGILDQWAKSLEDAVSYCEGQLSLWREVGVTTPPRYSVHYSGLRVPEALWESEEKA